jgi:hypothetical protein
MRNTALAIGAGVLIGGPTALAFFSGGFFDRPRLIAATAAWLLVGVATLLSPRPLPSSTPGRIALAALFVLAAWTALSLTWAPLGGPAQDDLQRLLLYLGFFGAGLALLRGQRVQRWLEPATALGASIVIGYGLAERLLPGLIELDRSRTASGRLEQPLTYWNAEGAVAAVGLVLAIRIAGDPDRSRALRGAAAAAGVVLTLGVYLTFSRGALAAVAAGLAVLIALAPRARPQLRSVVAIAGAGAVAAIVASLLSSVESLPFGQEGEPAQGLLMLATLTLLALAAAAVVMRPPGRGRVAPSLPVSRPAAVLAVSGVVLLVAAVAATALEGKPQGTSPQRTVGAARLGSVDSNRYRYWAVAADSWAERPLIGLGAAGFTAEWRRERERVDESADAHSLYIETAAELGAIGLALLVLFIGGVAAGLVRLYRLHPGLAAGPAAGFAAWAIHAGLDWNWEMPAVTLQALLLGAAALAWSEQAATEAKVPSPATDPGAGHEDAKPGLRRPVETIC